MTLFSRRQDSASVLQRKALTMDVVDLWSTARSRRHEGAARRLFDREALHTCARDSDPKCYERR